jgi:1-acyl-sn-glycerol-3-phosphate acyltransferase
MLPLPTKYYIYFGEPLYFSGDPNETDQEIQRKVDVVRAKIYQNINYGLEQRPGIFW